MLSLEPRLIEHLKGLPDFNGVDGIAELMKAEDVSKKAPRLYVVFDGYRVLESTGNGKAAKVETRWLVIVAVKQGVNKTGGELAREAASHLVLSVLKHLMGWKPTPTAMPLVLKDAPRPDFAGGVLLFPLAFSSQEVL